jgi:hypothetical protein
LKTKTFLYYSFGALWSKPLKDHLIFILKSFLPMFSSLPFSVLFHVCKRFQLFTFQKKTNFAQRDDNVNLIFLSKGKEEECFKLANLIKSK